MKSWGKPFREYVERNTSRMIVTEFGTFPLTDAGMEAYKTRLYLEIDRLNILMREVEVSGGRTKKQIEADAAAFKKGVWDQINAAKRARQ